MRFSKRSNERIAVGTVLLLILAGWLFYVFGVDAFLEAAYAGDSWSYFNEYAARWRGRQTTPTLDAFLTKARALLFRYAVLGTTGVFLLFGLYATRPEAFTSYFSTKTSPYNLALFRIAIFGTLLAQNLESVQFFAQLPDSLQFPPPGLSVFLPLIPTDPTVVFAAKLVFWAASVFGLLGLYTRLSATIALLAGVYVMGIPQLYGKVNHYHHLIWFTALLVPSRCADVLSVDALRRTSGSSSPSPPQPASAYAVPIRYAWLLLGVLYFFPGFWKFVSEGFAWALSENLKFQMRTHWFTKGHVPFFRVDRYPLLYRAGGVFTLMFELGFIFAVPFRSARPWAAGTAFLFHQSTRLFLSIWFWTLYPVLLFLIDVRKQLVRLARSLRPSRLIVAYEPGTPWQERVVGMLLRLDLFDRIRTQARVAGPGEETETREGGKTADIAVSGSGQRAVWRGGRFHVFTGLRLLREVPFAVLLVPFIPLIGKKKGANLWAGSVRPTGTRVLHLIGGMLLLVNVACGIAKIKSYPFSVYPTFAVKGDSTVKTLRVMGVTTSGDEIDVLRGVQEHSRAGFAPARLRGLFRSIFRVDAPDERTQKLRALWTVLRRERTELQAVARVKFYEATYSNDPDRESDAPLSETLITTLQVASVKDVPEGRTIDRLHRSMRWHVAAIGCREGSVSRSSVMRRPFGPTD